MTHPPAGPSTPPPPPGPRLADALDAIDLLLRTAELVGDRQLSGADPAVRMALAERLRLARRAVADLKTPARRDPMEARSQSFPAVARTGGPVTFLLPPTPTVRSFDSGERCTYGCTRKAPCGAASHWWSAYPLGAPIRA